MKTKNQALILLIFSIFLSVTSLFVADDLVTFILGFVSGTSLGIFGISFYYTLKRVIE